MRAKLVTAVSIVVFGVLCGTTVIAQSLDQAESQPENWLTYGGTYNSWRYSPLDQIDRSNVKRMKVAWAFQLGDVEMGHAQGGQNASRVIRTDWTVNDFLAASANFRRPT